MLYGVVYVQKKVIYVFLKILNFEGMLRPSLTIKFLWKDMVFQTCLIHLRGNRLHPLFSNSNTNHVGMFYRAIWVDDIYLQVQGRLKFKEYKMREQFPSFENSSKIWLVSHFLFSEVTF